MSYIVAMSRKRKFNQSAAAKAALGQQLLDLLSYEEAPGMTAAAREERALHLIEQGADLTLIRMGATALHYACMSHDREAIALALIKHGADINVFDASHSTPLIRASFWSTPAVINRLLNSGADLTPKDDHGQDACYYLQDRSPGLLEKAQRILAAQQTPAPPLDVSHLDDLRKTPAARDVFKKKNG